jgi:redox-sensitive bicupin YhaK (pirin superfamily)
MAGSGCACSPATLSACARPSGRTHLSFTRTSHSNPAYVVSGAVEAGHQMLGAGQMAVFNGGAQAVLQARTPSVLMLLGGAPIGPRFIEWNFVSSSRERIAQAKADWKAGRMKLPDGDNKEYIPLPPDPVAGPPTMS